ncbi:MAG: OmpA family protein [Bacteroidales bacterium]|nr:OmpA family protein [Bacteroidales bacterium]
MNKVLIILAFIFAAQLGAAQGQEAAIDQAKFKTKAEGFSEAWKNVKNGNKFFDTNNPAMFSDALPYYLDAYKYNSENPELNYRIGVCQLSGNDRESALKYLQAAYSSNHALTPMLPYYLARAEMLNLMFNEAEEHFNEFSKNKAMLAKVGSATIKQYKEQCATGRQLVQNPVDVTITNIATINSQWPDYSPIITADGSMMLFTSRREGSSNNYTDKVDGLYNEDIYISYNKNGQWQPPVNAGKSLNTDAHDATVALSPDGLSLLTYTMGDLYISYMKKEGWTKPEKLPSTINSELIENSACFSYDGNTIYFIRGRNQDPAKSNGDIYVSKRSGKTWSRAVKLPPNINTKYDEDGVYMLPDGKTLIFSSKGHNSMGGYDIFKTTLKSDGTWTDPVNLGYPINTPADNVYYVLSADGKTGYYSAERSDSKGYTDIYMVTYNKTEQPAIADKTPESQPSIVSQMTLVTGSVVDNQGNPITADVEIYDNDKHELVYSTSTNSATSRYVVSLPAGPNYGMSIKADGYLFHSENFNLKNDSTFSQKEINISLQKIEGGSKTVLNNLFFDTDKWDVKPESESELNQIVDLMTQNAGIKLEISGHTDSSGSKEHNKALSEKRANSVVEWLEAHGINKARLTARGAGDSEPAASNATEDGRKANRRVEMKIL